VDSNESCLTSSPTYKFGLCINCELS